MTKTIKEASGKHNICLCCGSWAKRPETLRRVFGTRKIRGKEYVQTLCKPCRGKN